MTWIRTIQMEDAGEKLRQMMEAQRAMYPKEYASPVSFSASAAQPPPHDEA